MDNHVIKYLNGSTALLQVYYYCDGVIFSSSHTSTRYNWISSTEKQD